MLAKGNPLRVRGVRDLARRGLRLVNRQRGTGTRLLLQHLLRAARVDPRAIARLGRTCSTAHGGVAAAVAAGTADAAPGVRAAAVRAGLDFLPLGVERYDLAIPRAALRLAAPPPPPRGAPCARLPPQRRRPARLRRRRRWERSPPS